ncbi:hypothetical protein MIR68_010984 [Amoeboaphelidium protococcarum]|nr:hypothetical protein MIR68_010984 [Amoeboaphelidium protococcarum]
MNPFESYMLCPCCGRPLVNEHNVGILRRRILASGAAFGVAGAAALPLLGFGLGGISAGSFAAWIQGPAIAAGSAFAILQSLGATGMGIVLFGSIGSAVGLILPLAGSLGWCTCHSNTNDDCAKSNKNIVENNQPDSKKVGDPTCEGSDLKTTQ